MKILADKVTKTAGVYHAYVQVKDEVTGAVYTSVQLDWDPAKETGAAFKSRLANTLRPILAAIKDVESKRTTLQDLLDTMNPDSL
jgi:hypothetical protein